jgi:Fe-Mn family superoxide dismutase
MFLLPSLPYDYDALEPFIDKETMKLHHDKHHQSYLDKFNVALEQRPELFEKDVVDILSNLSDVPEEIRGAVKNHGGGYYHHSIFWEMMSPDKKEMSQEVSDALTTQFRSVEKFKEEFSSHATAVFGSGWTWLVKDKEGNLSIVNTHNQDSPVSQGLTPLLGIDVWEHAYYLSYQNKRAEYVAQWWNIVHWEYVHNALTRS